MMRTRGRILVSAAAGALLATLATLVGMAGATTAADPPTVRAVPTIAGDAREGSTLTAENGDWGGTKPITLTYQWRRCGTGGGNCADLAGATAKTYLVAAADVGHRLRVLVRAANNAAKYMEEGGRIWLAGEIAGDRVLIRVKDTGMGISAELLPRIFDMFMQADPSLECSQGGLGIGLALVKRLTELQGGHVTVTSAGHGLGTEVALRFPLVAGGALVVFVRARKPGENLLTGVSTRRLVQASVGAPA